MLNVAVFLLVPVLPRGQDEYLCVICSVTSLSCCWYKNILGGKAKSTPMFLMGLFYLLKEKKNA